jgi:ABC-2 type transport system ATP-binding protein
MIKIKNLTKTYKNQVKALNKVNFSIQKNEFLALLGPNGAGKSTLINILAGNVKKTEGEVFIKDFNLDTEEIHTKKILGIVPQEIALDSFFTVNEILINQAGFFGIKIKQEEIDKLLKKLSLYDKKDKNSKTLSGGMRRRLLIAKSLIHKPDIIILDEPTAGVDLELRKELYKYLQELKEEGKTIILTTHYLEEAEKLCDRIIVINQGKVVADDSKENLKNKFEYTSKIELKNISKKIPEDFKYPVKYSNKKTYISARKENISEILETLAKNNINYDDIKIHNIDLEDVFIHLTK